MPEIRQVRIDRRKSESCWIAKRARNVYSQCGEDGMIEAIFERIGHRNRWCVEFGAWDGKHLSNTHHLIANEQWSGILIEGSAEKFPALEETYRDNPHAHCRQGIVYPTKGEGSLESFLATVSIPADFDLLSVDIDGNDYHVWNSLTEYRPRVVVIEFNHSIPNDVAFIQDADITVCQGSSLLAMIELGKRKGYELACAHRWNSIFVVAEEFSKLEIADNSIDAMNFLGREGRYFQGFDGKLFHVGWTELGWAGAGFKIAADDLQVMPEHMREWGDAVVKKGIPGAAPDGAGS